MIRPIALALFVTALTLTACDGSGETQDAADTSSVTKTTTAIPADRFMSQRPAEAMDLVEVKKTAKKGDDIVFLARVGGKAQPFVESLAIFVAADPNLVSCELMGEKDHCPVPQDYCCEDEELLQVGLATVQFVGDDGRPLKVTAEGAGGLEPLKYVVVEGVVHDLNDEGMFIVDARQVWVGGKPTRDDARAGSTKP